MTEQQKRIFRYLVMGGISFLVEVAILFCLVTILKLDATLGVAISFWFGLATSFVLQKVFAFQNKERTAKRLLYQSLAYGVLVLFNYAFTLFFVAIFAPILTVYVARAVALAITTIWNFIAYGKIIFKQSDIPKEKDATGSEKTR